MAAQSQPVMPVNSENIFQRKIRSFVRREGRLTKGQQRALAELLPLYGIEPSTDVLDLTPIFTREAQRVLEIGFGNGASLIETARQFPHMDFIGIEVHRPGVGNLLLQIEAQVLSNVRVICADAVEVLQQQIADAALDKIQIFFPDPWHKKRHHKRRLIQSGFVALLAQKLKPGGILHLATDWQDYAEHMLRVMTAMAEFENMADDNQYSPRPASRPLTKFEQRGQRLGHGVWDLLFKKRD